jgi:2'-hydroxyisoflavone reductase
LKLLVLGGTRFLGRHFVDAALAAGHEVTIFTRGREPTPWGDVVTRLVGNRDPDVAPGLEALDVGEWDGVVDTSGYLPRQVRVAATLLEDRVAHYLFVSSLSVYSDASRADQDESAALAPLSDPASEDVAVHYGALKAACEREAQSVFGERALIVRPGLIVGPHDPTDRFSYWVARFLHPELLGDRDATAVVPAPASRPIQFIDARDLAGWMLDLALARIPGVFNACSPPRRWTMGALIDALESRARARGSSVLPMWIDESVLVAAGVEPWTELPLWLPRSDRASSGFMEFSCAKAQAQGLQFRPLDVTLDDTAAWLDTRDNAAAWGRTLSAAKERQLLRPD